MTLIERFLLCVDFTDTCWIWIAGRSNGYGVFWNEGKPIYAHRFAYELWRGPIPKGKTIDHLCRNTLCCNPFHLEAVTQAVNNERGKVYDYRRLQTHCKRGHELSGDNIWRTRGRRHCKPCAQARKRVAA